jgi:hypothetical protein
VTQIEQVHAIGEAIGRALRFEEIFPDTARHEMLTVLPPSIVDVVLNALATMAAKPAPVTTTVAKIRSGGRAACSASGRATTLTTSKLIGGTRQ